MNAIVSTKGRYALRVMIELANNLGRKVPLKDIANDQGISLKYLESIMPPLTKAGFVTAIHGKGGGYELAVSPDECTLAEIITAVEGPILTVSCLDPEIVCKRSSKCKTLPIWKGFDETINDYLSKIKLSDLLTDDIISIADE